MSKVSIAQKTFLEVALRMGTGHVLDFTNTSFAQLFADLGRRRDRTVALGRLPLSRGDGDTSKRLRFVFIIEFARS